MDQHEPVAATISLREARLVVERLMVVAGVHLARIPAIREFVIEAETLVGGALATLRDEFDSLKEDAARPPVACSRSADGIFGVDAQGASALLMGSDLLDLAVATAAESGLAVMIVRNVRHAQYLDTLAVNAVPLDVSLLVCDGDLAERIVAATGANWAEHIAVVPKPTRIVVCAPSRRPGLAADPRSIAAVSPGMRRILMEGLDVDEDLWWWLYHESGAALTPDSAQSRHHTGASVLDSEGNLNGEIREDLVEGKAAPTASPETGLLATEA